MNDYTFLICYFECFGVQVRIQLGQGSAGVVTRNMLKNEGIGAFYKVCFVSTNFRVLRSGGK